jgi:hypothetical protein
MTSRHKKTPSVSITTTTTCGDQKNRNNEENRLSIQRRKGSAFCKDTDDNATSFANNHAATL